MLHATPAVPDKGESQLLAVDQTHGVCVLVCVAQSPAVLVPATMLATMLLKGLQLAHTPLLELTVQMLKRLLSSLLVDCQARSMRCVKPDLLERMYYFNAMIPCSYALCSDQRCFCALLTTCALPASLTVVTREFSPHSTLIRIIMNPALCCDAGARESNSSASSLTSNDQSCVSSKPQLIQDVSQYWSCCTQWRCWLRPYS